MTMTLVELKERLIDVEEIELMEALGLNSEDLVRSFGDQIDAKYEVLLFDYGDTDIDDDDDDDMEGVEDNEEH